jgi:hypothetical protein
MRWLVALWAVLVSYGAGEFLPGTQYDAAVPSFRSVLGYDPGERITRPEDLVRYMQALAAAAPGRMKVFEYGRSWEGRPLIYAVLGTETNIRRLAEIQAGMKKLADPRRTSAAEARALMEALPAVVWLGYGVHGNEISSPDAALLTAYHLLAARNDKMASAILANVVLLLDPSQNPDGRARFVHHFEQTLGLEPDPHPAAAEHNEPWPSGRTNHYHFDLNRDWFAVTQPETRGRIQTLQQWFPLVFVDLHEMGSESTYYFAPEAVPYNPHLAQKQRASLEWFGRNNAQWFDRFGFPYFTREVYDAFYPGYGASWPSYYGGIAMTYEQASARGLVIRRSNGTVLTFRDSVRQHFIASLSTAEEAARRRRELLENFYDYRRTAIEEGSRESVRAYVLARRGDLGAVDKLAALLALQGVEVGRATQDFSAAGAKFPAGSYVINLAQPAKRLIRTLLDTDVAMEAEFLEQEERRRKRKQPSEIYDVTAWSLPLLYSVEAVALAQPPEVTTETARSGAEPQMAKASVAYLVPWNGGAAARFLVAALRQNLRVHSTDRGFTQNGRQFPRGTLIVRVKENGGELEKTIAALAGQTGAEVYAANSGWVEEGVNFGSRYVKYIPRPRIALLWDWPTQSNAAGHTRFVLERQFHYPVTVVRTLTLARTDLNTFDVVIFPPSAGGDYFSVLGAETTRRLKDWVTGGGTLIGLGNALAYFSDTRAGLLAVAMEHLAREEVKAQPPAPAPSAPASSAAGAAAMPGARAPGKIFTSYADYERAIRPDNETPDSVPGVLVRAQLDPDHWITAGPHSEVHVLVTGNAIFTPIKLDKGVNAGIFAPADRLVAAGYLWEENRRQLAYKPFLIVENEGRGHIIGFTADPNFRAYMDGLNVLFINAVFRGPAQARPF